MGPPLKLASFFWPICYVLVNLTNGSQNIRQTIVYSQEGSSIFDINCKFDAYLNPTRKYKLSLISQNMSFLLLL